MTTTRDYHTIVKKAGQPSDTRQMRKLCVAIIKAIDKEIDATHQTLLYEAEKWLQRIDDGTHWIYAGGFVTRAILQHIAKTNTTVRNTIK